MLVPKLRFKRDDGTDYPEWEEKALREVGIFIRGLSYGKNNVTSNYSATLVLRSNNINEDKTLNYNDGLQFVNKEPKSEQILKEKDIVICMANGSNRLVGKAAQYDGKYHQTITVGAFCGIFRCNLPIIRYTFQSPDYSTFLLLNLQGGDGAIANLKGDDILSFVTYFPCLEEQQKIADFLSTVDEVIAQSEKEVQNLEQQKKAAMQKIFSQEVRFKREDGMEYPEWEEKALREVGIFIRGLSYGKNNVTSNYSATLVLRSNNINEDKTLNYNDGLQFVNKEPKSEQILKEKDIVICMANGSNRLVGKAAQYDGKYHQTITVGAFCGIFRCNLPIIRYTFQSPDYSTFLLLNLQGGDGAIANLKGDDILSFVTYFPCLEEQQKIADFLSTYDEAISYARQELDKWKKLKKGLLQQMFV